MTDSPSKPKTRRTGQVKPRGQNKWLIAIFRGYKPNGSNDYFYKTFNGTKGQAEQWLREALTRRDRGEPIEDPDILFCTLFDKWLKSEKRSPRTQEIYQESYEYYVEKTFGQVRISSINARAVQSWINTLVEKPYSTSTIRFAYKVLRSAIRYALDDEILLKNPLKKIKLPKSEKRKPNILSPDEALDVLNICRSEPGGVFVAFLLWSGTRPNEACGLQWKDIDWEKGSATINRNLVRLRGAVWRFGPVKADSNRTFTLPKHFMIWLKEHKRLQGEVRLKAGRFWQDHDLCFCNKAGDPLASDTYRKLWKRILEKAGVSKERQKMRVYDSRHSVASLLLLENVPTKVVSARLGHSSTSITEDVYQHILSQLEEQATDKLESAIMRGKSSNKARS